MTVSKLCLLHQMALCCGGHKLRAVCTLQCLKEKINRWILIIDAPTNYVPSVAYHSQMLCLEASVLLLCITILAEKTSNKLGVFSSFPGKPPGAG